MPLKFWSLHVLRSRNFVLSQECACLCPSTRQLLFYCWLHPWLSVLVCVQAPVSFYFIVDFIHDCPSSYCILRNIMEWRATILIDYSPKLTAQEFLHEDCSNCPLLPLLAYFRIWNSSLARVWWNLGPVTISLYFDSINQSNTHVENVHQMTIVPVITKRRDL